MAETYTGRGSGAEKPRRLTNGLRTFVTWWAILGGLNFIGLVAMSIISIVGRKLFSAPITGDMELLMMGAAIGSAAFLPLCEMDDYHVRIDAFMSGASERVLAVTDVVAHALICLIAVLLAWRTSLYALDAYQYKEYSTLLLIPLWIPVAMLVPSFLLLALTAIYRVSVALRRASGRKA